MYDYNLKKPDYAIISNNQNPEYTKLFPYIQKRWNQLGIKTVLVSCHEDNDYLPLNTYIEDDFGNITFKVKVNSPGQHEVLHRYFRIMMSRFYVAAVLPQLQDKLLVISDGDLFPINQRYILQPSCNVDIEEVCVKRNGIVTTNQYPNGKSLATYVYGKGSTFTRLFDIHPTELKAFAKYRIQDGRFNDHDLGYGSFLSTCSDLAWRMARIYANDEHILNYFLDTFNGEVYKCKNRKWLEQVQEMNNLYDYQIDMLKTPFDLCPFIEFHNMRSSTMTEDRWNKLFGLLEEFDKYPITPNNYYYESIDHPWTDTIISKDGELILSQDNYED